MIFIQHFELHKSAQTLSIPSNPVPKMSGLAAESEELAKQQGSAKQKAKARNFEPLKSSLL